VLDTGTVLLDLTRLLVDWSRGNQSALDELTPLVYRDLHQRAKNYLRRERPDHTLQPTALIHEAYLRLVKDGPPEWNGRAHFFAVACRVMRQILVDHARRHAAGKRGSGVAEVSLDDALIPARAEYADLMALDYALAKQPLIDFPADFVASCSDNCESDRDMAGRRIGPYRLNGLIGHGGMGAVYLGVRDDDQYQKQVAIKLLKRGMDTDFMLSRFRQERADPG
jgi:RNA polymerase sigma factor (TIGR02999 family)